MRKRIKGSNGTSWFSRFAKWSARQTARPLSFALAAGLIVAWLLTGFVFNFSDTWQLIINTATTIVTFLMVFVIQNTQNRDTEAIQMRAYCSSIHPPRQLTAGCSARRGLRGVVMLHKQAATRQCTRSQPALRVEFGPGVCSVAPLANGATIGRTLRLASIQARTQRGG